MSLVHCISHPHCHTELFKHQSLCCSWLSFIVITRYAHRIKKLGSLSVHWDTEFVDYRILNWWFLPHLICSLSLCFVCQNLQILLNRSVRFTISGQRNRQRHHWWMTFIRLWFIFLILEQISPDWFWGVGMNSIFLASILHCMPKSFWQEIK